MTFHVFVVFFVSLSLLVNRSNWSLTWTMSTKMNRSSTIVSFHFFCEGDLFQSFFSSFSLIILMIVVVYECVCVWSQREKKMSNTGGAQQWRQMLVSYHSFDNKKKSSLTAVDGFLINCRLLMWKDGDIRFFSTLIAQFLFKRFAFLIPLKHTVSLLEFHSIQFYLKLKESRWLSYLTLINSCRTMFERTRKSDQAENQWTIKTKHPSRLTRDHDEIEFLFFFLEQLFTKESVRIFLSIQSTPSNKYRLHIDYFHLFWPVYIRNIDRRRATVNHLLILYIAEDEEDERREKEINQRINSVLAIPQEKFHWIKIISLFLSAKERERKAEDRHK